MVDHGGIAGMHGGFIGVDVFFVLSGFLITSLLLAEYRSRGRLDLPAFWVRRAKRLLPALVLMVLGVAAGLRFFSPDSVAGLRGDAFAALAWVANWRFSVAHTDYFAQGGEPSPLQHTWSLGVEEQYYLIWPLLLVGLVLLCRRSWRRWRWAVFGLAITGAVASAVWAIVLAGHASVSRVYFGTDTRAQALLIGAAAAAALAPFWPGDAQRRVRSKALWQVLPVFGLVGLAVAIHVAAGTAQQFQHGLLILVAVAAIAVIASVTVDQTSLVAKFLALRPLVALGAISYGVYLWHWPVFLALDGERTGLTGLPLFGVRVAATLAIATVSYWVVEKPIRRMRLVPAPLLPVGVGILAAAACAVVVLVPVRSAPSQALASGLPPEASNPAPPKPPVPVGPRNPNGPLRVSVFGDSIAWTLMRYLPATPGVEFIDHTKLGCGIVQGGPYRYFGNVADQPSDCDSWPQQWTHDVSVEHPDAVLLLVGRWETMDRQHDGQWMHVGQPAFDSYLTSELQHAFDVLGSTGARVLVATEPYNRRGEQPDGSLYPEDVPDRVTRWNELVRAAAAKHPGVRVIDLNKKLTPDGHYTETVDGIDVRSDGVHLTPAGVDWLTPWLVGQVRQGS
ncbi:acyltransferase [Skermania sp. ID1734]|nr:acyltransferase [Skermania sp. ID1734]